MKEVSFNFSLTDFLAYLFPGTVTLIAIAGIVRLTPYEYLLFQIKPDIFTGLILVALAYAVGVIISSLTINEEEALFECDENSNLPANKPNRTTGLLSRLFKTNENFVLCEILPRGFERKIEEAFDETFGKLQITNDDKKAGDKKGRFWTSQHFYAIRSLVKEKMPACSIAFERQSSLRQFRRNSIIPICLLGLTGFAASIQGIILSYSKYDSSALFCCISLFIFSLFGTYGIVKFLKEGIIRSRRREVREVYTGLLAFHKYQNLTKREDSSTNR